MRHTAGANSCAAAPVLILLGFRNGRDRFDVAAVESCGIKDASNSSGTLGTAVRGGGPMWNNMKTTLLLAGLTGLLLAIGQLWAGEGGLVFALVLAGVMNLGSYFFSDKIALAMSGAQPVSRGEAARLYAIVERLAAKANIPVPKIYQIPTDSPNAFATGRNPNHASVAVTRGILDVCDDEEIEGVLAHELGHVRNRDILTSAVVATLAGAITMIARMVYYAELFGFGGYGGGGNSNNRRGGALSALAMLIVAPLAALMIQLWISRTREFEADHTGAEITGNPYG